MPGGAGSRSAVEGVEGGRLVLSETQVRPPHTSQPLTGSEHPAATPESARRGPEQRKKIMCEINDDKCEENTRIILFQRALMLQRIPALDHITKK